MESTAPFRYHHGPRNAHVWFHSERSSTSLWNEITKWRGMYKNATAQSLYTDIFPESHGKVSGRYERESISQNWRTLGPGTGTPKKIYKSANPNLKNPATDSKPKKIRCCMFFGAKVANFLFSTHSPLIFVILPSDIPTVCLPSGTFRALNSWETGILCMEFFFMALVPPAILSNHPGWNVVVYVSNSCWGK